MNDLRHVLVVGAAAVALLGAASTPAPVRHLVYSFSYSANSTMDVQDSGIGAQPTSGMSDYIGNVQDRGQIVADVVQVRSDMSLVIRISEQARDTRSAAPNDCVVYGNTNVACEPGNQVTEEEIALLRTLGREFVNTERIDAKNHWRVEEKSANSTSTTDYTITKNTNGILSIQQSRQIDESGANGFTAHMDGAITYDLDKSVPLRITEDTIQRQDRGAAQYKTQNVQIGLTLMTDSLGAKAP